MSGSKDLNIKCLGDSRFDSPLKSLLEVGDSDKIFCDQNDKFLFDPADTNCSSYLEQAGPREKIFFDPSKTRAAIVTCGGLCPGINDVIRGIVMELYYRYGVKEIVGIPYGYKGLVKSSGLGTVELTPYAVRRIHEEGGSMLATSRGPQDTEEILDFLKSNKINVLFTIGGDGTLRGALSIADAAVKKSLNISVIGIPKTVDNDILYIDRSFGFETAFSEAAKTITAAHNEARGAHRGVGLVKLMGRHSGFIACFAALAMPDVNFVLIPEVPFKLEGPGGFLSVLEKRLKERGHVVIVAAEGAGQDLMDTAASMKDASGNVKLKDIGLFLKEKIAGHFGSGDLKVNFKYIDPSYTIRAIPATPFDSVYSVRLAQHAVHAAMSGRTRMAVGMRHGRYVHLPMELLAEGRKQVNPQGALWTSVLSATGQPPRMV